MDSAVAPTIHFRLPDGSLKPVRADGSVYNLMELGKRAGVPGIEGQCGGNRACATCHLHIDSEWMAVVGPPNADESELLSLTTHHSPNSRLGCQITITSKLDGLIATAAPDS